MDPTVLLIMLIVLLVLCDQLEERRLDGDDDCGSAEDADAA